MFAFYSGKGDNGVYLGGDPGRKIVNIANFLTA